MKYTNIFLQPSSSQMALKITKKDVLQQGGFFVGFSCDYEATLKKQ